MMDQRNLFVFLIFYLSIFIYSQPVIIVWVSFLWSIIVLLISYLEYSVLNLYLHWFLLLNCIVSLLSSMLVQYDVLISIKKLSFQPWLLRNSTQLLHWLFYFGCNCYVKWSSPNYLSYSQWLSLNKVEPLEILRLKFYLVMIFKFSNNQIVVNS